MISEIFVRRPHLATVIAVVTTIAGLLSMSVIPVAQCPDIVPPQVEVSTSYPGASASVVEATVVQPIESQVIGVDKAIYMKSVSGNDGSYTLLVTFELGTDPNINTVNVNNRVQVALSKLPDDARRQGVSVKKKSSAMLGVIALYSPKNSHDELFISNYVTINLLDADLGNQCADPVTGTLRDLPQAASRSTPRADRVGDARDRSRARRLWRVGRSAGQDIGPGARHGRGSLLWHGLAVPHHPHWFFARRRSGRVLCHRPAS
jgi:hypothetical protein